MATVTVLGAGMMASALCVPIADRGHTIRLVGTHLDTAIIDDLRAGRPHTTLKLHLPDAIEPLPVEALGDAMRGADLVVIGVSSAGTAWAGQKLAPFAHPDLPLLAITKGLAPAPDGSLRILPDALKDHLGAEIESGAVVGPCIAGELARRADTCVFFSGRRLDHLQRLCDAFATPYYHPRPSLDLVGDEVCAALKNAYALAIGLGGGIHARRGGTPGSVAMHNLEAAVFAQALAEMTRLVAAFGADPTLVAGLPGAGDLMVTCNGGRTGRFGHHLGMGLPFEEAVARMEGATLEAVEIITTLHRATPHLNVPLHDLPLLQHLIEIVVHHAPVALPLHAFRFGRP